MLVQAGAWCLHQSLAASAILGDKFGEFRRCVADDFQTHGGKSLLEGDVGDTGAGIFHDPFRHHMRRTADAQ